MDVNNVQAEEIRIKKAYADRLSNVDYNSYKYATYIKECVEERETVYARILKQKICDLSEASVLEIGAGGGSNIPFFFNLGVKPHNFCANELLPERVEALKQSFPDINVIAGNFLSHSISKKFDVVFQSTVFTSIISDEIKKSIADRMVSVLKEDGFILWYDFIYNNPNNKEVKGVSKKEIRELFPKSKIDFYPVTLAPPIGRRLQKLYKLINTLFPFLRTHVVAVIIPAR